MQKIEKGIYIDSSYSGITIGALIMQYGTLLVDAPPHPDDSRSWRLSLRGVGGSANRLLVNLDAHYDRTLGVRGMECPIIAQDLTADEIRPRPAIFKGSQINTGADWELTEGVVGTRWAKPNLTFSDHAVLDWDEHQVILEHHPGPQAGAAWVMVPDAHVVFVGDAVVADQPPFLAFADIPQWIDTLGLLLSAKYKNYLIVSSRGGLVDIQHARDLRTFLKEVGKKLERLNERNAPPDATESLIPGLLSRIDFPSDKENHYTNRLRHGLYEYYVRHYMPAAAHHEGD